MSNTSIPQLKRCITGDKWEISKEKYNDVPIGSKHRISCAEGASIVLIEVQTGSSFAEDDIIRYEDDFGRK
jgi:mannose-6-phosphate isomerase-like protein (cupin superfamily)